MLGNVSAPKSGQRCTAAQGRGEPPPLGAFKSTGMRHLGTWGWAGVGPVTPRVFSSLEGCDSPPGTQPRPRHSRAMSSGAPHPAAHCSSRPRWEPLVFAPPLVQRLTHRPAPHPAFPPSTGCSARCRAPLPTAPRPDLALPPPHQRPPAVPTAGAGGRAEPRHVQFHSPPFLLRMEAWNQETKQHVNGMHSSAPVPALPALS